MCWCGCAGTSIFSPSNDRWQAMFVSAVSGPILSLGALIYETRPRWSRPSRPAPEPRSGEERKRRGSWSRRASRRIASDNRTLVGPPRSRLPSTNREAHHYPNHPQVGPNMTVTRPACRPGGANQKCHNHRPSSTPMGPLRLPSRGQIAEPDSTVAATRWLRVHR